MTDLAVIILAKNEKLHIARCLEKLGPLVPEQIFIVDCFSTDGTREIAGKVSVSLNLDVNIVEREWPGFYAKQFNWALDNLPIKTQWVLRLDADEYLYPDTIEEIKALLPKRVGNEAVRGNLPPDVTSLSLSLSRRFWQRDIRFGGRELKLVRIFKYGIGRCQDRAMDEHVITSCGRNMELKGKFVDDNLNSREWWKEKHRGYAKREAMDAIDAKKFKRSKTLYYACPPYFRAFAYFCWRYFVRLGFLDGRGGWQWNFWQGLWYRWLVDRTIGKIKREMRSGRKS